MFGPNTQIQSASCIEGSHRDKSFFSLFQTCQRRFQEVFQLRDYDILFLPGSATVGVEALMFSLLSHVDVIGPEGTFKSRWTEMASHYNTTKRSYRYGYDRSPIKFQCDLETSESKFSTHSTNALIDAISSFPYRDITPDTPAFVTCPNKILGSYPGLSIVGVRKDKWDMFRSPTVTSYLNLARYKLFAESNQTPSTAPVQLFEHLKDTLGELSVSGLRSKIDSVCNVLVDVIGKDNIIGAKRCPVLTFSKESIPDPVAEKYELYGINNPKTDNYQIFTYSEDFPEYLRFAQDLNKYAKV